MKRFFKRLVASVTGLFTAALIWGCTTTSPIPAVTNPAMESVAGVKAPFVKVFGFKITLQICNDAIEAIADFEHDYTYPVAKKWAARSTERSNKIATGILGAIAVAGLGGGGLSTVMALKKLPKGAIKKEDHEIAIREAGEMDPEEFKKG